MSKPPKIPNVYSRTKRGNDTYFINNVDGRTAIARRMKEVAASLVDNLGCTPTEGQIALYGVLLPLSFGVRIKEVTTQGVTGSICVIITPQLTP